MSRLESTGRRTEPDIDVCRVAAGIGIALLVLLSVLFLVRAALSPAPGTVPGQRTLWARPAAVDDLPRLQRAPASERRRLEQSQRERLGSYGWVDREQGIAHVPIEAAMRALAARGIELDDAGEQPASREAAP